MPGRFSKVSHWSINDITIDQPFEAAAIQLMSEACHGTILNVTVLDSPKALLGIGMDWGSVGPSRQKINECGRTCEDSGNKARSTVLILMTS